MTERRVRSGSHTMVRSLEKPRSIARTGETTTRNLSPGLQTQTSYSAGRDLSLSF